MLYSFPRHKCYLGQYFLKCMKKSYYFSKMAKMAFLAVNNFFWCIFKNTEQNNNCVFIVFKAESEPKCEEKILIKCFSSETKNVLFWG